MRIMIELWRFATKPVDIRSAAIGWLLAAMYGLLISGCREPSERFEQAAKTQGMGVPLGQIETPPLTVITYTHGETPHCMRPGDGNCDKATDLIDLGIYQQAMGAVTEARTDDYSPDPCPSWRWRNLDLSGPDLRPDGIVNLWDWRVAVRNIIGVRSERQ